MDKVRVAKLRSGEETNSFLRHKRDINLSTKSEKWFSSGDSYSVPRAFYLGRAGS